MNQNRRVKKFVRIVLKLCSTTFRVHTSTHFSSYCIDKKNFTALYIQINRLINIKYNYTIPNDTL